MKFTIEQYGDKIGVDGNLSKLIENKKVWLLLTITNDNNSSRNQFVLTRGQAQRLIRDIQDRINDPLITEYGFEFA